MAATTKARPVWSKELLPCVPCGCRVQGSETPSAAFPGPKKEPGCEAKQLEHILESLCDAGTRRRNLPYYSTVRAPFKSSLCLVKARSGWHGVEKAEVTLLHPPGFFLPHSLKKVSTSSSLSVARWCNPEKESNALNWNWQTHYVHCFYWLKKL